MSDIRPDCVSTIIPVYNRPERLCEAVESVLAQTYRPIEILIADDGSTDSTPQVARGLTKKYEGVISYHRHDNAGPGPARELGRIHARGEFIQYLDSDDRLLPNKFEDQVEALRNAPEADIAYGMTRLVDDSGKVLAEPFKWTGECRQQLLPGLLVDRWWCTHTPLYRRSLTDRIGAWSDLRWSQDWEYDSRAAALCANLAWCGSMVSEHVHHFEDRQTSANSAVWRTDPKRLRNRIELLTALASAAEAANVSKDAPEARHFARWCFSISRQCLIARMPAEALRVCEIAVSATLPHTDRSISLYSAALRYVGPGLTRRVAQIVERLSSGSGKHSMRQSFDGQVEHPVS